MKNSGSIKDQVSADRIMDNIERICSFGIRFAGTPAEQTCADWIEGQFREIGLSNIYQHRFPCISFESKGSSVEILRGNRCQMVPSEPAAHSPATPKKGIEGSLRIVEKIPGKLKEAKRLFEDHILLLQASELFQVDRLKRTMKSRPRGILLVDDRFPNDWTVAVGFPRYWIDFLTCPIVNIPYMSAWEITRNQPELVRLHVDTSCSEASSQNVIAEIRGSRYPHEVVVISGHHDSVINNPGADDNATGVAATLELARFFASRKPKRTMRFISYGAEEQLSEGARLYADSLENADQIQFVLNVDAIGGHMGRTQVFICGSRELDRLVNQASEDLDFPAHPEREISPFSDHFFLNSLGVPGVWYYRPTYLSARHFHHSRLETLEVLSPGVLESTVNHQARLLQQIVQDEKLPFPREIPKNQMKKIKKLNREWAGQGTS